MPIQDKTFIITGGCGAIGGTTARAILAKGGYVVVFDILPAEAGEAKVKTYSPDRAWYYKVDIADIDGVNAAVADAIKVIPKGSLFGGVHCAAGNSSRPWSQKMTDSAKDFLRTLTTNGYGTFVVDAAIADGINSQYPDEGPFHARVSEERGVIINIASAVAFPVPARCLTYGPTKTTVLGITSAAADFLGPCGIRVNSVSPAIVASAMMGERLPYFQGELDAFANFPRRTSLADEVADGILFLIMNPMMNAHDLKIDGGWKCVTNWAGAKDPRSNAPSLE